MVPFGKFNGTGVQAVTLPQLQMGEPPERQETPGCLDSLFARGELTKKDLPISRAGTLCANPFPLTAHRLPLTSLRFAFFSGPEEDHFQVFGKLAEGPIGLARTACYNNAGVDDSA
jgi:hypothetical protein